MTVQIEVLYTPDDENAQAVADLVEQVVADLGIAADITYTEVKSDKQAFDRKFIGSPTVRFNGVDPWPIPNAPAGMRVRAFFTDEGMLDYPTYEMLHDYLAQLA